MPEVSTTDTSLTLPPVPIWNSHVTETSDRRRTGQEGAVPDSFLAAVTSASTDLCAGAGSGLGTGALQTVHVLTGCRPSTKLFFALALQ